LLKIVGVETVLQIFGNKVKSLREAKGLSQEALAFKAGFDRTYISLVERGKRNLSLSNICRFAQVLEVKPADLLSDL
jgi:transcriptional regulator with XRE-family HTH domain